MANTLFLGMYESGTVVIFQLFESSFFNSRGTEEFLREVF